MRIQITKLPKNRYSIGGVLQSHGSDWSDGLITIGAGGSHEENPYEGIQLGTDENGTPNLVEENETIFNDYVFSNRILADEATKKLFHLPKKKEITFADISKRLEKEIAERPNDPISQAGFKAQMQSLQDQQERQKQEMEAKRARAAFEALSPEEQTAVMQQLAQREAMAQQAVAEQQAMQQPSPEEMAAGEQIQTQADGSEAMVGQEPQSYCSGGKMRKYDFGGELINALNFHTKEEYMKWLDENKIKYSKDKETIQKEDYDKWMSAIQQRNPMLADAMSRGYDFGAYKHTGNNKAAIKSISKGNWRATNGLGWLGSDDPAWLEATSGMNDEDIKKLSTEDVAKLLRATDSYKKGNEWLQNKDNALLYLNTLLNDPETPQVAKDYANKFVDNGQWKDGFNYDYATVFGSNGKGVRETSPGTYWHTPIEAVRGNQTGNLVWNPANNEWETVIGDVPSDWTSEGTYSWATPENDYSYNYYRRPEAPIGVTPGYLNNPDLTPEGAGDERVTNVNADINGERVEPKHRAEWLRYAGLFGPAVGLGMMAAGVGRPDKASLDAAISGAGDVTKANYQPIGNYLTYRPMDIWFEQNRMDANARATDRAIMNSSSPSRMAGLLASGYNSQIADGELYRKALEYNDALQKQVADFNRGTDMFNAEAYTRNSQFNADAYNRARQQNAQLRLAAAREKMDADAGWYNGIYGNLSGLFKGLSDLGTENYRMNRISEMAADGVFGNLGESNTGSKWIKKKSKGGKVNKKRGLTF